MNDKKSKLVATSLKASDYVHLHNHTHYSVLDGLTKVDELVDNVKQKGMSAVAMTDHGTMSGTIDFYKTCKAEGIKPIIGIETYVAARTIHDRDPSKDKRRFHLVLLAMNQTGYRNLIKLSTIANLEGMYYKPRIDHDLLEKYNEGLIATSACLGGEISEPLQHDDYDKAKEIAKWYKKVFGDRYYIEIQDHEAVPLQHKVNEYLFKLAKELDIQCILTSDAHYVYAEDQEPHEILLCIGTGAYLADEKRMSLAEFHLHVTDPIEVIERWGDKHPEIIINTKSVADRCNVEFEFGKILIPIFPTPKGYNETKYLHKLVWSGLAYRYGGKLRQDAEELAESAVRNLLTKEVVERADYELGIIHNMGFDGYFLIVQDFINWGKDKGIIFGPGRGSAAGSIVAFALRITDLDPLKYELLFERFLNPDRVSMPDIDIDIQDTRRDEVIQYCVQKYGPERVANIATFGKMFARNAVRDVARVLQVPYSEADRLAKLIPAPIQGRHIPLKKSIIEDPDLKKEYETSPTAKKVIDFAIRLEGTIRSHGVHAAGVVIAPDDIVKYVPLEMAQKGVVATQFPMGPIEDLGLLKMDFLGLSNLSIIKNTLRIIKKVYGQDIELDKIPLDDIKTFELFQRGDTTGVFQLESAGMKRYLKELKPSIFDDIVAMGALYRPGPMQFIDEFIKRKHGERKITYPHDSMKNALESTYGILVYQEQVMQISKEVCGFTGGEADTLRKAIGKKNADLMAKMKDKMIVGGEKVSGIDRQLMERFWKQLEDFAAYCFNKSHAACYGLISYWTAYLKTYYPDAFMAALMTSDADNIDRLAIEIAECKYSGLIVLPPDINQSYAEFAIVPNEKKIRFGMAAVKGVGVGAVEEVLHARDTDGEFSSISDFCRRVSTSKFNRKAWESLIKSGAFDRFASRSDMLFNLDTIIAYASRVQKEANTNQADLFGGLSDAVQVPDIIINNAPEQTPEREQLLWERELLGLYLSAHPLDKYDDYFAEQTVPLASLQTGHDKKAVVVGGVLSSVRTILTKSGSKMAFLKLEDKSGEGEVIVFPKTFEIIGSDITQDAVVKVSGKVSSSDRDGNLLGEAKVIADEVVFVTNDELDNYKKTGKNMRIPKIKSQAIMTNKAKKNRQTFDIPGVESANVTYSPIEDEPAKILYIHVKDPDNHNLLKDLKIHLNDHTGLSEIILVLGEDKKSALRLPYRVEISERLISSVSELYGSDCVVVK
ncbi:DNA polymerase III subunit alpha [Candidatus Saccharibacteria bacterium]|nr:DNA polymerase III subunit alpha [Candidatus Saccharibacteria bacterium]NCU40198.1 DNA polymerase III subunit alpha [Candidatus Saccharibacteria bacterium]